MWAFMERRRYRRYKVEWNGSLRCVFPDSEEDLQIRVTEVSSTGARLALDRLQIGPHHLVVGNAHPNFELSVLLPEGLFMAPIGIRWYNWDENERCFSLGVEFSRVEEESRSILKHAMENP